MKSLDVLLLFILVIARIRIDTLADLVLPQRHEDVRRLVGESWSLMFPADSYALMSEWLSDPVTLLLISTSLGLLLLYVFIDVLRDVLGENVTYWLKLGLIYAIIALLVFGKAGLLIGLRHITEPAAYTHDGGVIQTEITIDYFLNGLNPYVEDYLDTPMATWGIEFRTALHHYPYLPWTFIFSTPFYLLSEATLGWFDQRFVYLLLFGLTLLLAQALAPTRQTKLLVVMLMGLNPILASDVIFGQNDSFILFWLVLAMWLLSRSGSSTIAANVCYGLACASKPTAWFLAPFWGLYLLRDVWGNRFIPPLNQWLFLIKTLLQRMWPVLAVTLLIITPWLIWNPDAMIDDVWRWSSGTAERPYQIRGWGLSNFVLAFQLVTDRLAYWPFWATEIALATPMLLLVLHRQVKRNHLSQMIFGYVALLFAFFYSSRFLNENYLGYLAAFLILAILLDDTPPESSAA